MTLLGFSSPLHLQAVRTWFQLTLVSERRVVTVSYARRKHPRAMLGWLRDLVSGREATTASEKKGSDMQHAVLKTPLLPPDGSWASPLEQATFGLGWYVWIYFSLSLYVKRTVHLGC